MQDIRSKPMTIDEAQKYIDSDGPYLLKGFTLPKTDKTVKEFLYNFIWRYNQIYPTAYVSNHVVQTNESRSRSMTDMARICRHYFPKADIVDVRNALLELHNEEKIGIGMCGTIQRRIYVQGKSKYEQDTRDEFGWKFNKPQNRRPNVKKSAIADVKKASPTKEHAIPKKTNTTIGRKPGIKHVTTPLRTMARK